MSERIAEMKEAKPRVNLALLGSVLLGWIVRVYIGLQGIGWAIGNPNVGGFWDKGSHSFLTYAMNLANGHGYASAPLRPTTTRMPLYPLFMATFLKIFGERPIPLVLAQATIGALTVYLTYRISRLFFKPRISVLAAGLVAIHPYMVSLDMRIHDTGLFTFLLLGFMYTLLRSQDDLRITNVFTAGLILGFATLARPSGTFFLPFVILWLLLLRGLPRRLGFKFAVVFVVAWALVLSPWIVRNYAVFQAFIPLTTTGGKTLAAANNPYYDTLHPTYDLELLPSTGPYVGSYGVATPPGLTPWERDRWLSRWGINYIFEHPSWFLRTAVKKASWLYYWFKVPRTLTGGTPTFDIESGILDANGSHPSLMLDLIYGAFWVPVLILAAIGIVMSRKQWRSLTIVYLLLVQITLMAAIFIPDTRMRTPVDPFFCMWASLGACFLAERVLGKYRTALESSE